MNEFLILFILKIKSSNIYEIKKFIDKNFAPFLSVSTGAIIPALKKLESQKIITSEKIMTEGGLRKSFYSVTEKGEEYFNEILNNEIEAAPQLVRREFEVLINVLNHGILTDEQKILLKEKISNAINSNIKALNKSIQAKLMNVEFLVMELKHLENLKSFLNQADKLHEQE